MLNKTQKEALCALLLIQGKDYRTIRKTVHLSFDDIKKIKDQISGEDPNYQQKKKLTKTTEALMLFSQEKLPLDVSIELDMEPKEVEKAYSGFLKLKGLSKIAKNIVESEENFLEILELHEFCKNKCIDKNNIEYIMDKGKDISQLTSSCDKLVHMEQDLKKKSEKELKNLENIRYQIQNAMTILENTRSNLLKLENKVNQQCNELSSLNQSINSIKNKYNYKNYEQRLSEIFHKIISEEEVKIPLIIVAFLEVLRANPIHNKIFSDYYQIFKNGNIKEDLKSKQDYVFFNFMTLIYDLSKKIHIIYRNRTIDDFHRDNSLAKSPYHYFF